MKKSIPLYYMMLLAVISVAAIVFLYSRPPVIVENKCTDLQINIMRSVDYKYTKPLLLLDIYPEDPSFFGVKTSLQSFIESEKGTGKLQSASVYVRKVSGGKWFSVNPDEQYSPGSVMKVAMLLTYLREAESNPSVFDRKINFVNHFSETLVQTIVSNVLKPGKSYTVRELLDYMIIDSDNDATALLNNNANMSIYFSMLKGLKLSRPGINQPDYPINVTQCSFFLRMLYASTFLSPEMSEYALELLTRSKFDIGITKTLPHEIAVAHKFGERNSTDNMQLHETAIVYFEDSPYLITVMTKGKDQTELSHVLEGVSSIVFEYMKNVKS